MTTTVTIPELGEGVDSVDVVAVLIKVGERITVDQPLIEVETEKAAVEIPSTSAGTVTEIHVEAGQTLTQGAPVVTVDADEAAEPTSGADAEPSQDESPSSEPVAEATTAVDSDVSDGGGDQEQRPPSTTAPTSASGPEIQNSKFKIQNSTPRLIPAAPTVRRFAREVGMDITQVKGSGPGGRISIDDVKLAVSRQLSSPTSGSVGVPSAELPDFSRWGDWAASCGWAQRSARPVTAGRRPTCQRT
jgi:pyruvate dehydrogenase E2 component (dihydrolipoamide acetyltransferase)